MSNIRAAAKVADQIVIRIFDQRQFTAGEIEFVSKEFANDRLNLEENFQKLLRLNQEACVIADTNLDESSESGETLVRKYHDQVSALNDKVEQLLAMEAKYRVKEKQLLADAREERAKRIQDYQELTRDRLSQLRESLKAEEAQLELKYRQFEQSLRPTKSEK